MLRTLLQTGCGIITIEKILEHREHICENIVIFDRVILEIAAARAEIERTIEIGGQANFLIELFGMLLRQIHCYEPVRATQLRIAKLPVRANIIGPFSGMAIDNMRRR